MTGASKAGRREGVRIRVAEWDIETARCLALIRGRGIPVRFKEVDEKDIRNRRRLGMDVRACDRLLVTER